MTADRSRIELAVLDMAGTTVAEGGAVYRALADTVAAVAGRAVPAELVAAWTGADKREAITGLLWAMKVEPSTAELDEAFADFSTRLDAAYLAEPPVPIDGIESALTELRANGVRVVLTTGFPTRVATGILDGLGWHVGGVIDGLVTAEQVGAGRPSPRMIERAMALTGITDAGRVLVAGDTRRDLEAGANAGAAIVVGVLTGALDRAALEAGPSTHVIASAAQLPALIASLAPRAASGERVGADVDDAGITE